jgi:transcription factor IIIB subunit 2
VNVFELGHVYLQLVQALHLQLPLVDPAHHISRFAALLEFGDDTSRVASDAVRLVQRFDRDWLTRGRRPAGVCGAALLLAARMNHFRRSVEEIVQVVKIADSTLKKRLDEFKKTPSAALSLADFRAVWLEEEMDPPAFTKGKEREEEAKRVANEEEEEEGPAKKKKRKRKRKKVESDEEAEPKPWDVEDGEMAMNIDKDGDERTTQTDDQVSGIDPELLNSGILTGTSETVPDPLFLPEMADGSRPPERDPADAYATPPPTQAPEIATDIITTSTGDHEQVATSSSTPAQTPAPASTPTPTKQTDPQPRRRRAPSDPDAPLLTPPPTHPVDEQIDAVLIEDVSSFLQGAQGAELASALNTAEQQRQQQRMERQQPHQSRSDRSDANADDPDADEPDDPEYDPNWADGLDDDELQKFIMSEEEVKIKERVWVELNRDYLEAIAGMCIPFNLKSAVCGVQFDVQLRIRHAFSVYHACACQRMENRSWIANVDTPVQRKDTKKRVAKGMTKHARFDSLSGHFSLFIRFLPLPCPRFLSILSFVPRTDAWIPFLFPFRRNAKRTTTSHETR